MSSSIHCKDLHGYLKTLSAAILDKLYSNPPTCLAVFRELTTLARHYVMRLLFVMHPVPQAVVTSWINPSDIKNHHSAISSLTGLHIFVESAMPGGLPGWILANNFRKNLKVALLGGGQPWGITPASDKDKHGRDIKFLDSYAMERWECVLHFMVGSQQSQDGISSDAVRVLLHSGLMKLDEKESTPAITTAGFQFLLMDTSSQVWHFMLQYLDSLESRGMDLVESLAFLFQLSFLMLGRDYSTDNMTESQQSFLQHLREFGLIYQRKRRSGRFYPTRLAINLASGLKNNNLDIHKVGYVVVETNYRVYAYTCSPLQIALLGLFCELMYRFPNLCIGVITRDSIRQSLRSGITAEQIVNFLRMNAHPEMLAQNPVIPPTIVDQIKLWEIERDRFNFKEGVLYSQFLSHSDFELLQNYAKDLGVLIWDNPNKRVMVVSRSGHDEVKKFWKRHKQEY